MITAARWFVQHYRTRATKAGVQSVARQLRKQGVPLNVALAVLVGRI